MQFFSSLGLYAVLFFLGIGQWRKYWIPLLLITIIPLIHNAHQHYSYLFLSFMMFAVLWGARNGVSLLRQKVNFYYCRHNDGVYFHRRYVQLDSVNDKKV